VVMVVVIMVVSTNTCLAIADDSLSELDTELRVLRPLVKPQKNRYFANTNQNSTINSKKDLLMNFYQRF